MGFPVGWTDVEGVSRTSRIKQMGNSVQVQIPELIGKSIMAIEQEAEVMINLDLLALIGEEHADKKKIADGDGD